MAENNLNTYTQIDRAMAYFTETASETEHKKMFKCNLCGQPKNGSKKSNLLAHLRSVHYDIYDSHINISKRESRVTVDRMKCIQHLTELVTINKMPFKLLLKSGFQKILSEKLKIFDDAGIGINLKEPHLHEAKSNLHESAQKIKDAIKAEVQNKLFSLSADIVSKNNRSLIGIYISYIADAVLKVRNIGMKELKDRHTGKFLCSIIKECLGQYGWDLNRIIALVTDNGSNMKTLLKSMNEQLMAENNELIVENESEPSSDQYNNHVRHHDALFDHRNQLHCDEEIADILYSLDADDEEEIQALINDDLEESEDRTMNNIAQIDLPESIERMTGQLFSVNGVNCAAHTIQLAIKDALRKLDVAHFNIIRLARTVVIFVRKESTRNEARKRGLKFILPTIDIDTRWSSTYMMVSLYSIDSTQSKFCIWILFIFCYYFLLLLFP